MSSINMSCVVKDCNINYDCHHRDSTITFHRISKACHKVLQKLAVLSSDNQIWQPNQKICSVHFQAHCFDRTGHTVRLREDAMPTLLLPNVDVQEGEHSDTHLQPQSIPLSKPKEISVENMVHSISNLDAIKSTKDTVPVSTNELGCSSLSTEITITSTSEPDIKTEPLTKEIEEEHEVDVGSPNLNPEISVKSLLKPSANDIKTEISSEINVTDYSINNIATVKTEPTMEVESDRTAMSCDHFPSTVKVEVDLDSSETRVIQAETSGDSDHKTDTMVPVKDELKDSISYHDDFNQIKYEKKTSNIEKILCKICQTYVSDRISLGHHLENCYRRVCGVCGQTFTRSETFVEHALTHELPSTYTKVVSKESKISRSHKCRFCIMRYKFPAELRNHLMTHTTVKHYMCSYCGNNFSLSHRSKCERTHSLHSHKHINKKTDNKASDSLKTEWRFDCSICKKSYHRKKSLINHKCIITTKKSHNSSQCSKRLVIGSDLGRHARTRIGEKRYECSHCSKRFTTQHILTGHIRTHTGEKPYDCSHCSKRFTTKSEHTVHVRTHTGEKPYECPHCCKRFTQLGHLKLHKLTHTGEKSYECSHCSKRFNTQRILTYHIRTHTGEKPYDCSHCSKRFTTQTEHTVHIRTHTGEKPYECPHCCKRFTQLGHLTLHKLIHTGEKSYECSHCSKRFIQLGNLNRHKLTHTGEKPYECSDCSKRFITPSELKAHMRTHTGEKPYECPHCSKRFSHPGNLNTHKLTHTGEKPYECSDCSKRFGQLGLLNRHKLTHTRKNFRNVKQ